MKYRNIGFNGVGNDKIINIDFNYGTCIFIKEIRVYKKHCLFRIFNNELIIFIFK